MSSVEDELSRVDENVTLSELRLAIQRLQEDETTNRDKVRKTNLFLGMLSEQLGLPGLFTLPRGAHFVYKSGNRYLTKSSLPEYITSEEAQPVADRDLIPEEARNILEEAGIVSGARTFPVDSRSTITTTELPPAAGGENPTSTSSSSLAAFATSGRGGLRNDRNETAAIEELQTFLGELGLDTGGIDGKYGPRTTDAVRSFQSAITGVTVDGDAGPETIGKIQEVRTDIGRIQELVAVLMDSVLPFVLKSGLAQLLERDLTAAERQELQTLLDKYENFRQEFPEFRQETFTQAATAIETPAAAEPAAATTGQDWEEIDIADEATQTQFGIPNNAVILDQGRGEEYLYVPVNSIDGLEIQYSIGTPDSDLITVTPPESTVFAINQEIHRRNTAETPPTVTTTSPASPQGGDAAVEPPAISTATDAPVTSRQSPELVSPAAGEAPAAGETPTATPSAAQQSLRAMPTGQPLGTFVEAAMGNIRSWLTSPRTTPESTQTFLDTFEVRQRTSDELLWLDDTLNNTVSSLVLKIARGDTVYSINDETIRLDNAIDRNVADVVRDWIRNNLRPALQSQQSANPATAQTPIATRQMDNRILDLIRGDR